MKVNWQASVTFESMTAPPITWKGTVVAASPAKAASLGDEGCAEALPPYQVEMIDPLLQFRRRTRHPEMLTRIDWRGTVSAATLATAASVAVRLAVKASPDVHPRSTTVVIEPER